MFPRITDYVHGLMEERVKPGDYVIDATMGNGHDTLYLARLVGNGGRVYGYDVQQEALDNTLKLLDENHMRDRVEPILESHAEMLHEKESIQFVVFNLGYLPGSDKSITTMAETTIQGIQKALHSLKVGGMIVLVIYWGHENGKAEKEKVECFATQLPYPEYMVLKYQYVNPKNQPPFVIAIERRK